MKTSYGQKRGLYSENICDVAIQNTSRKTLKDIRYRKQISCFSLRLKS